VLRIDYQGKRFLFAGDIEQDAERLLLERKVDLRADVLKVAHHGSATSSSESFLAAVRPTVAVISSGAANTFGHPHFRVINRLKSIGGNVIRLDYTGGVIATIKDGQLDYKHVQ
jgi:beta-lactamase superfamily II metal-dependent hydrolase